MSIIPIRAFVDNYIWAIPNESEHTFAVVDPGDAMPVISYAHQNHLQLNNILLTHHHADHVGGVDELIKAFSNVAVYGPMDARIAHVNHRVQDEEIIHIGPLSFRILSTPGHTSTHICYQEPTHGLLFCGDTLFSGGCGRVFDGTMEALYHSINLLKHLPKDTKVYCGHEYTQQNLKFGASVEPNNASILSYSKHLQERPNQCTLPSTIAIERKINPFMRTDKPEIQRAARSLGVPIDDDLAVFRWLRELKNEF